MLHCVTGLGRATQEHGVGARGSTQSELVERENSGTGLDEACTRCICNAKGTDSELGHFIETGVISDGANEHGNLVLLALHVSGQAGESQRSTVNPRLEKPLQHDLVEGGIRATGEEAIQLHKQSQVRIVALGGIASSVLLSPLLL